MTSMPNTESTSGAAEGFRLEGPRLAAVYERWRQLARRFVRAERAGLQVIWDRCTAVEHRRIDDLGEAIVPAWLKAALG